MTDDTHCLTEDQVTAACDWLCENLTDALENFLDARWAPRRPSGTGPQYYFDAPTFDSATLCDIVTAYNQVVAGTQRLIELALGRPVEMQYGIRYYANTQHDGIHAQVEWSYPEGLFLIENQKESR